MSEATVDVPMDEGLWDAKDVARYVKGSVSWVYKVTEAGLLPCLRIGSMLRFEPEVVRAFVRSTRAGSAKAR